MSQKKKGLLGYCSIIVVSIAAFIYSDIYRELSNFPGDPSSAFMPQLCAGVMLLISTIMLIGVIKHKEPEKDVSETETEKVEKGENKSDFLRGVISIALLFFLVITFESLGFIISMAIYLFLQQLVFTTKGNRHWIRTVAISVLVPAICYLLFIKALNYLLPLGLLR